jgi:hypothetical protein
MSENVDDTAELIARILERHGEHQAAGDLRRIAHAFDEMRNQRDAANDLLMSIASRLELPRSRMGPPDDIAVYEQAIDGLELAYAEELQRRQRAENRVLAALRCSYCS